MSLSIVQKLKIKEGMQILTLHAPQSFEQQLHPLPANVSIAFSGNKFNQLHWFVRNKAQLDRELNKVMKLVTNDVLCWIYYPKSSSKIQTNLTRDKGWDELLKQEGLKWVSLISFDETWSTFGFRLKTEADNKKQAGLKEREIFKYIDPLKKEISLPDDLAAALNNNKVACQYFQTLSFTNRKEYVEWVITAKRIESRNERIIGTIDKLSKSWKNPRNI